MTESDIPNCFFTLPWDEFFDSKKRFEEWLKNNHKSDFAKEHNKDKENFSFANEKTYWEFLRLFLLAEGVSLFLMLQNRF